jgi:hypothetical protein
MKKLQGAKTVFGYSFFVFGLRKYKMRTEKISPSPCPLPSRAREKKDGFPFPDQVEDRFHGNDRRRSGNDRIVRRYIKL